MAEITTFREDLWRARSLIKEGHLDQALALLDRWIESEVYGFVAMRERGYQKSFCGDHQGAIADFNALIRRWPTKPDGFTCRAAARERAGDLRGAIEDYSAAISINPQHPFAYLQRGRMKAASGDLSGAVGDFSVSMDYDEMGPLSGLLNRGVAKYRLGDLPGAMVDLTEAMLLECRPV
ncbi:MAG TPA: tetratricopeptide repeat protein, partial [Gemmata sp.]|nr:tetratricopeptide repeat protein [Gemmata sp.]